MSCVSAFLDQSQYVLAPSLQLHFVDPQTGGPLSNGTITFYKDIDRVAPGGLKPVYRIGGPPNAPTFTALPNPITLSPAGIFIDPDEGDEILPYYNVLDSAGNIELYYIEVRDSFGNLIEAVEHFPQVDIGGNDVITQLDNFIPNGQFLLHQDIPNFGLVDSNTPYYPIAYGGWIFDINTGSTSTNFVTFERYNSPTTTPTANPRYACRVRCTIPDPADSKKDLGFVISDVNFLQGEDGTFQVTAYSNDGVDHNVSLVVLKNFGGPIASPPVEELLGTFTVTPEIQNFLINFTLSSNIGETLGTDNTDYLEFILRGPRDTVSDIFYVDIMAVEESVTVLTYDDLTPGEVKNSSFPASFKTPAYDGSDKGNFVILDNVNQNIEQLGFSYVPTHSAFPTGTHIAGVWKEAPDGFILENGADYAVQDGSIFMQYPDLFDVIFDSSGYLVVGPETVTVGTYAYGTGLNGFTNAISSDNPVNLIDVVWNRFDILQPAPDPGTSGFIFTLVSPVTINAQRQQYQLTLTPASSITAGAYYRLIVNTTGPQFVQLFWFTIDGVGSQPLVTFDVQVKIDLLSTDTAQQVRDKILIYANGLFSVPDLRNNTIRYWGQDSAYLPTNIIYDRRASIFRVNNSIFYPPTYISVVTGNALNNIGSSFHNLDDASIIPSITSTTLSQNLYFNGVIKT